MLKRNCFIIYLLLTGDFLAGNGDLIGSYERNASYGFDYGDGENPKTVTPTHFTILTKNVNNHSMILYDFSSSNDTSSTQPYPSFNLVPYQPEISDGFMYFKIGIALLLIIIGLVANSFSFLIIVKQGLIQSGVWLYLATLAITDSLALIMIGIYDFSKPPFNILGNMQNNNDILCKFLANFAYLWSFVSNYIVTFMSVERALVITNPYRVPPGQKRAAISVLIVAGIILIGDTSFVFNTYGVVTFDAFNLKICTVLEKYQNIATYFLLMDVVIYGGIPIILTVSANFCIIVSLNKRHRNGELNRVHKNSQKDVNITIMLCVNSLIFVITTTPLIVYFLAWDYFYTSYEEALAFDSIGLTIINCLVMMNHSCNFFAYVLTGEIFREKAALFFRGIICCWKNQHSI